MNNKRAIILGLDISTSITGVSVIQGGKIIETFFLDTRNKKRFSTIYNKAQHIEKRLKELKSLYKITDIYIEQSLHSFRSGFSSAQTLSTLSRFNGIISWVCWNVFNIEPQMIAASSARKQAGVTIKRGEMQKKRYFSLFLTSALKLL